MVAAKTSKSTNLIPFNYGNTLVRVIDKEDGPWFVLADLCVVLEIANSRDAAKRLEYDEKGVANVDTLGGPQSLTIVNESGLWSLVLTSRKPEAKRFKKWLTSEVIPSIRKTGSYQARQVVEEPQPVQPQASMGMPQELLAFLGEQAELIRVMTRK